MASNPPAACCTVGVKHEGKAKGQFQPIGDVEAYISRPADGSTERAILLLTDVIGHRFINAQLIADQLAANGYPGFDLMTWLHGPPGHLLNRVEPVVQAIFEAIKSELGYERVGAIGYCFGAKYAVRMLHPSLCDVAYPVLRFAKEAAFTQAVAWFNQYL
ncbi:uncharacterized protein N7459_002126 [Penicillium hispanicum]|uniref:uncharacterized protein n=1 Tax=Penicillium hispanicum TaxID=1080232 RepID=UPI0025418B34|nr:uncharacterized protein N7459_002126 [Penicillium hispanicum]KAJ5591757.1 hypothetical protein N7459_002126 [Penicillium hispanicum]